MWNKFVSAMVSACCGLLIVCGTLPLLAQDKQPPIVLNIKPPHVSTDKSIKYDYDIVYVRGPRRTDGKEVRWSEFSKPKAASPHPKRSGSGNGVFFSQDVFITKHQGKRKTPWTLLYTSTRTKSPGFLVALIA